MYMCTCIKFCVKVLLSVLLYVIDWAALKKKRITVSIYMYISTTVEPLCKDIPEMRTPPLIKTLDVVPRVSRIEGLHCIYNIIGCTN